MSSMCGASVHVCRVIYSDVCTLGACAAVSCCPLSILLVVLDVLMLMKPTATFVQPYCCRVICVVCAECKYADMYISTYVAC